VSDFAVEVIKVGPLEKHPNADSLEITKVYAFPVIVRKGDLKEGDKAYYVPIDAIMPDRPEYEFLGKHRRIKAKRLRGTFSMGLLMPVSPTVAQDDPAWEVGKDVAPILGITKYEPPPLHTAYGIPRCNTDDEASPGWMQGYTDIQQYRRYPHCIPAGTEVVITEKIHGTNARAAWHEDRMWVGSHKRIKKENDTNLWWKVAKQYQLHEKLKAYPGLIFFYEVYGAIQDLKYGCAAGEYKIAVFDIFDISGGKYLDYDHMKLHCTQLDLPMAPELFRGPFDPTTLEIHGEGRSTLATHIKEGCVIKTAIEGFSPEIGRTILKYVSEEYLTRKDGTECH